MMDRFEAFVGGITACYRYIQKIKATEMTELGLRGTHVMCLYHLHRSGEGLTSAELSRLCAEDKAAISRTLAELESRGYLNPTEGKKYRTALTLTQAGQEAARQMEDLIESWVDIGGGGLTEQQRCEFYATLALIGENLKQHIDRSL